MAATEYSSALAFSFLLTLLIAGSLVLQTVGHLLGVNLAHCSLLITAAPALWLTYVICFTANRRYIYTALALSAVLTLIGIASRHMYDFTPDGMGYQQPSAEAILNGLNPFWPEPDMLWQQIYPSGIWAVEASLAALYGSVESTKMIQVWWLFIAIPVFLSGLTCRLGSLRRVQVLLATLCVFSATVLAQVFTHYVDASLYLSGITFMGALMMYERNEYGRLMPLTFMAVSVAYMVNVKLSGIYHAPAMCAAGVVFLWLQTKRIPWRPAIVLLVAGLVAVFFIGYRPYVTSYLSYGINMFPDNPEAFSGAQRPSSFDGISAPARLFYSMFSITGGAPHEPAQLKIPGTIHPLEWKFSGDPDPRTGGFGPLFSLGFIVSFALFAYALARKLPFDKGLVLLSAACLLSSALFPQSWWLRYVPLAYAVPFLLVLSIAPSDKIVRAGFYTLIVIFAIGAAISESSALHLYNTNQSHFLDVAAQLRSKPEGSVYLVPPVANYRKYNDAYMPLMRRLKENGVESTLKVGAPCDSSHLAELYSEYWICY